MAFLLQPVVVDSPSYLFSSQKDRIYLLRNSFTSTVTDHKLYVGNCRHFPVGEPSHHVLLISPQGKKRFQPKKLKVAYQLFEEMGQRTSFSTDNVDFTKFINDSEWGVSNATKNDTANPLIDTSVESITERLFNGLFLMGTIPDRHSLIRTFSLCARLGSLDLGRRLHSLVIKIGLDRDKFTATCLVDMYSKCREIEHACKIFDQLHDLDVVSWNSLLSGYASNGLYDRAMNLFSRIQSMDLRPNHYTVSIVLGICGSLLAMEEGKQVHAFVIKSQLLSETAVGNSLLTMYSKCGMMKEAEVLFEKLPNRNFISWTAIITGFYQNQCFEKALRHFYNMRSSGLESNEYAFAIALASCGSIKCPNNGRSIHAQVIKNGIVSGIFVATAIVDMYSKFTEMCDAKKQFEEMGLVTSDVTWNALLAGFVHSGQSKESMEFFNRMLENCIACNHFTYSTILKACSSLPSLASGKQIHSQIIKTEHEFNMHVGSSLIDMYSKCGSLTDAEQVFNQMPMRDTVSWNSIINAQSQNGFAKKAFYLFEKMIQGTTPTGATFLALLSACSHAGLVQEGQQFFESMVRDYSITLEDSHYSSIVDLLGRAGQLENARDFIKSLPIKPTASIWRPLLAACRYHRNLQMAELVANCILEMDPGDATAYITLSNMYAEVGRWDDVEKQRTLMEHRGVKKEPGCSWIEVNNRVHKFFSRDKAHKETPIIYEKLEDLVKKMKDLGYAPDSKLVLHHREGDSKEEHIIHHSEKLAVSFGLISLHKGSPIRIFKNLRVCSDCHVAMKYIARITGRDIILRDNYRFHYFKQGRCSCGDYW